MIHGNLKRWEIITLFSLVALEFLLKAADALVSVNIPAAVYLGLLILGTGVLFFSRPIWLMLNIRRIKRESVRLTARVCSIDNISAGRGQYKMTRISFVHNGRRREYELYNLLTFKNPQVGDEFEVLYNESRPDELLVAPFYVMSAALWVIFGVMSEILLVLIFVLSIGG